MHNLSPNQNKRVRGFQVVFYNPYKCDRRYHPTTVYYWTWKWLRMCFKKLHVRLILKFCQRPAVVTTNNCENRCMQKFVKFPLRRLHHAKVEVGPRWALWCAQRDISESNFRALLSEKKQRSGGNFLFECREFNERLTKYKGTSKWSLRGLLGNAFAIE